MDLRQPNSHFDVWPFDTPCDATHIDVRRDELCYMKPMADRADIIAILRRHVGDARAYGATALYLFGSTARDEAGKASDVDLFVDYDPESFSFIELIRLRERLSEALGRPADLTTRQGLHPLLRPAIEAEAIKIF